VRPAAQSHFHFPLTRLLGSEAAVRVLRELALHGDELTTTSLSRRVGITDQSVRNALAKLSDAGVLRRYGQGRAAAYQLDATHPVARMLIALFQAEDQRVKTIHAMIRQAVEQLHPRPLAVWMFGSAARREDGVGSDLDLLLIVNDPDLTDLLADAFREALAPLEEEHRLAISVVPLSAEDVVRLAENDDPFWRAVTRDAFSLHGPRPESMVPRLKAARASAASVETVHG
jgi:DNA-binding transcriptional ArsR family regulator